MSIEMKWPNTITIIRHGQSEYNALRLRKDNDPLYRRFKVAFEKNHQSLATRRLAEKVSEKFALGVSDYDTPLTHEGRVQAVKTGFYLVGHTLVPKPDVILCSPYLRTRETLKEIGIGWEIDTSKAILERRVREQEHGLSLLYNDRRVFQTFHPEQRAMIDMFGPYWYQYPQGESVPMVQERTQSITDTVIREYAGMNVLIITHHIFLLALRTNFERLSPEQYIALDESQKPVNCGVTVYKCNPKLGKRGQGKLELALYNERLY
jgi:broad specificity phosphatase PhoE